MSNDRKPSSGTQIGGSGGASPDASASSSMPMAEAPSLVGEVLDGRYRIVKKLGEGGMGEVYAAEHVHIEKHVAIKLLKAEIVSNKEAVSRFRQEARSASSIGHKNIIGIDDFGVMPDGRIYLCMELLNGQPLNDMIQQPMAPERLLNILIQTGHGLAAAHAKGIVHRDMKPENIFVTVGPSGEDIPKLLDFGIAKVAGHDGQNNLTRTGTIFGTPFYMAPEQALGQQVDARVDIYAMGVILYEVFAGSLPFRGDSFMGILTQHITTEPEPIEQRAAKAGRQLPVGLAAVVGKAMQKDPDKRYRSMDELVQALVDVYRQYAGAGMSSYMQAYPVAPSGMVPVPGGPSTGMMQAAGSQPYQVPGMPPGVHPAPTPPPMGMGPGGMMPPGQMGHGSMPPGQMPGQMPGMPPGGMSGQMPVPGQPGGSYPPSFMADSSSVALPKKSSKAALVFIIIAILAVGGGVAAFVLFGSKGDDSGGGSGSQIASNGSGSAGTGSAGSAGTGATGSGAKAGTGSAGSAGTGAQAGTGSTGSAGSGTGAQAGTGSAGSGTGAQAGTGSAGSGTGAQAGTGSAGSAGSDGSGAQAGTGSAGTGAGTGATEPSVISVAVTSNVAGAVVYDGKKALGPAPQTVKVIPDEPMTITVKAKGYKDQTQTIDGTDESVAFNLTKLPTGGGTHKIGNGSGSGSSGTSTGHDSQEDQIKKFCAAHPDDVRCGAE